MPRVTKIVWLAFLGVLILGTVSGCRVHVHGRHCYHRNHLHHSTRPKKNVVHHRTHPTSSPKTSVRHKHGHRQGTTVEYNLHDDMVLPPKADDTVEYDLHDDMVLPPHSAPGLAKKTPSGVRPGLAKKGGTPPGQAKKEEMEEKKKKKYKKNKKWR